MLYVHRNRRFIRDVRLDFHTAPELCMVRSEREAEVWVFMLSEPCARWVSRVVYNGETAVERIEY